jgi:hypothetical protein
MFSPADMPPDAKEGVVREQTPSRPRRRSMRGALLVIVMFALGALVLWGLFLAPRATSPPAPAGIEWGMPDRPLRVVAYGVAEGINVEALAGAIRPLKPDFVVLHHVESRDLPALATAMGMTGSYHPNNYARSQNAGGRKSTWGTAILSGHPLYESAALTNEKTDDDFGVWVTAVVDGVKFVVAGVSLSDTQVQDERASFVSALLRRGRPPLILHGDGGGIVWLKDAGQFKTSREWKVIGTGTSGRAAWINLTSATAPPATGPAPPATAPAS